MSQMPGGYEQRLLMLAAQKQKGRTGSQPYVKQPTLQATQDTLAKIGGGTAANSWRYPPSQKGPNGPLHPGGKGAGLGIPVPEGNYDVGQNKQIPSGIYGKASGNQIDMTAANQMAARDITPRAKYEEKLALPQYRELGKFGGPTLAGKLAPDGRTSPNQMPPEGPQTAPPPPIPAPVSPTQAVAVAEPTRTPIKLGNPALGLGPEDRIAAIQREIIENRRMAMNSPREMDYWKLPEGQRGDAYAAKANAALNIGLLNKQGQDMTRAMRPVEDTLVKDPMKAAEGQQALAKASGEFGKYGPEPDLALRANLLAGGMAERRKAVAAEDAAAAARTGMREDRRVDQETKAKELMDAERRSVLAGINAQGVRNDPDMLRRVMEADVNLKEAQATAASAQAGAMPDEMNAKRDELSRKRETDQAQYEVNKPEFAPTKNIAAELIASVNELANSSVRGGTPIVGTSVAKTMQRVEALKNVWPTLTEAQRAEIAGMIGANLAGIDVTRRTGTQTLSGMALPLGIIDVFRSLTGTGDDLAKLQSVLDQLKSGKFGNTTAQ